MYYIPIWCDRKIKEIVFRANLGLFLFSAQFVLLRLPQIKPANNIHPKVIFHLNFQKCSDEIILCLGIPKWCIVGYSFTWQMVCNSIYCEKAYMKLARWFGNSVHCGCHVWNVWNVYLFAERKQVKRFAPPPVKLQVEKQLASQECASNTEKVWQLADHLERPDIKILVHCVSFIPLLFTAAINFINVFFSSVDMWTLGKITLW